MLAARNLGGGHRHDGAGDMAVAPAGHVTARRGHRDGFLPRDQPGHDLHLDVLQRRLLRLGEFFHIGMGEGDVLLEPVRDQSRSGLDRLRREQDLALVFVELRRIIERGLIPAGLDLIEDVAHDLLGLGGIRTRVQSWLS